MIPQFIEKNNFKINFKNINSGIFIFFIGLFKKVIIADQLSKYVNTGFDQLVN